jgi:MFS transporter, FLVCR family, MFS-domain-containing protein 7
LKVLVRSHEFWLTFLPFSVYVGFFNAISTLLNQILNPYGFTDDSSGIVGAVLIVVGLVMSAISSPILSRNPRFFILTMQVLAPVIALSYLGWIWVPEDKNQIAPYILAGILGAASFSLVPIVLEWVVEVTHPVSPEISSVVFWAGGQMLGGIFLIIMDALKASNEAKPPLNMKKGLIFQAVVSLVFMFLPIFIGYNGRDVSNRRIASDVNALSNGNEGAEDDRRPPKWKFWRMPKSESGQGLRGGAMAL